jgi:phosphatidylglycerol---prolipoprotein diacylglyceryl transferase
MGTCYTEGDGLEFTDMYPLLHAGHVTISSYQGCLILAFAVSVFLLLHANRRPRNPLRMGALVILPIVLASLFGAKLMFILADETAAPDARSLWPWEGGYYYHGGLAGGIAGYVLYHAWRGNNVIDGLDLGAPFAALGEAIARVGCFLGGCCWGIPVSGFPGIAFPKYSQAYLQQLTSGLIREDTAASLPVHPAQLYMSASMMILFLGLRFVARRPVVRGEIVLLFLVSHCFVRFWIEFLRADMSRPFYGLSLTQWVSIVIYMVALSSLVAIYRRKRAATSFSTSTQEAIS